MPSLGDFSQRGLPASFVSQWDHWLAQCMVTSRASLGDAWLDAYLCSPIWRFFLLPGVIGENLWAGILMPSVDRVGRYFPLTIAAELPAIGESLTHEHVVAWFSGLERHAISTLERAITPDELTDILARHPYPMSELDGAEQSFGLAKLLSSSHSEKITLTSLDALPGLMVSTACRQFLLEGAGKSLWWSQPHPPYPALLLCHQGLPHPSDFTNMLIPQGNTLALSGRQ